MHNDKDVLKFFIGLVSLQFIIKMLKQTIKQNRPVKTKTYGMPSSRSAFMFYIITFFIITNKLKQETIVLLLGGALVSVYAKYHMREHNLKQLVIGAFIGICYAYFISNF